MFWRQKDVRAAAVARADGVTIPDEDLRALIRAARARGLRVMLFPIIDLEVIKQGEWRGTLAPPDRRAWWKSYETFVLHYAAIAADEQVDVMSVGSELGSTEGWRDEWIHLIAAVDRAFDGKIIYSANWDHYDQVSFWERVDLMGVSAYFALGDWAAARPALVAKAEALGKPLVLTEVGWPSVAGAAEKPWDYTSRARLDLEEQRRCYETFVAVWKDEADLAGVFFWNWTVAGGAKDRGYSPRGKPAEKVLRDWYR